MKRIYLILIAAVAITFTSCSDRDMDTVKPDTGQGAPIINLPEGASQGKIMVKFKPEAASFLDAAVTRSIGGAMTRSGISDMDVILQRIGTHKLERIFPIDNRTEERTRKAGLNLWYVIHFDEDTNLEQVAKDLSQVADVAKVQFSHIIQRSYDQLSQDLCINNNPAVLLVFWGTLSGMNDVTHLCFFDIPLISNIPNMVYLAPTCKEEYLAMLEWSIRQNEHPVAIRVPATDVITCGEPVETDYSVLNRYKVTHRGSKVAILALGSFYGLGQSVASLLKEKANIDATLINPRYITGVDNELMDELKADHELVITLEDGVLDGGFGEKIARYYGATNMKVLNFGAKKEFVDRYDIQEFLRANHLTDEQIVEDITAVIG